MEINKIGKIELVQRTDLFLGFPRGFIVTDSGSIVICDIKTSDFKVYDLKGNAIKILGRKGYGPNEFAQPWLLDYSDKKMLIADSTVQKMYIYKIDENNNWAWVQDINALSVVDAKLMQDPGRILFCRFPMPDHPSGKSYILLTKDIKSNVIDYLLTFEAQLGANADPVDFNNLKNRGPNQLPDFIAMPQWKYCDFYKDDIYFTWTGNLEIVKINLKNKKTDFFGNQTKNYVRPKVTSQLKKAYLERQSSQYETYTKQMSWVAKLFVDSNYVGLVYSNFDSGISRWRGFVQIYEREGKFLGEYELTDCSSTYERGNYFYDKQNKTLYCLTDESDVGKITFYIHIYKIST